MSFLGNLVSHVVGAGESERWASERDAAAAKLLTPGVSGAGGIVLGEWASSKKGRSRLLVSKTGAPVLVIGPCRSGKTAGIVVPTLLRWHESSLVYDNGGQLWSATAEARRQSGVSVLKFAPTSVDDGLIAYNPLGDVRLGTHKEIGDVATIAAALAAQSAHADTHWEYELTSLFLCSLLHVLYAGAEKTIAAVGRFLLDPATSLREKLVDMSQAAHYQDCTWAVTHPDVFRVALGMLNKQDNELSALHKLAEMALRPFMDPVIERNMARNDFKLRDLMDLHSATSVYVSIPPQDIDRARPLLRVVLAMALHSFTERPNDGHDVLIVLDGFPELGRLNPLVDALPYLGGYGVRVLLTAQSEAQVTATYGSSVARAYDEQAVRVFFPPVRVEDAHHIAEQANRRKIVTGGQAGKSSDVVPGAVDVTPQDVMDMPRLFAGGENSAAAGLLILGLTARPIRATAVPYSQDADGCAAVARAA